MASAAAVVERAPAAFRSTDARDRLEAVSAPTRTQPNEDGTLSARWLSAWLGLEPARIAQLQQEGDLLGFPAADGGEQVYPVWQFGADGSVLRGTRRVIAAATEAGIEPIRLHALMAARVGLAGGAHLAGLLRDGRDEHVVSIVRAAGSPA